MDDNYKAKLISFLEIIDYKDNRDKYTEDFLKAVELKTVQTLISGLPKEEQGKANENLSLVKTKEELAKFIEQKFTQEQFNMTLKDVTTDIFLDVIKEVKTVISDEKEKELNSFLANLSTGTSSPAGVGPMRLNE